MQHRVQPAGQVGPRRYFVGNARVPDLGLCAHDALSQGGRLREERVSDLFGAEVADLAQRQRDLGVRRQGRMAAGEDQPQLVVVYALLIARHAVPRFGVELLGDLRQRCIEPSAPPQAVDRLEAARRHEPRPGVRGHTVLRPTLDRRGEGVMQRLLGEVKVAEQADQGGENATRLGAVDGVYRVSLIR